MMLKHLKNYKGDKMKTNRSINEIRSEYEALMESIMQRKLVIDSGVKLNKNYEDETENIIIKCRHIKKELASHYDVERIGSSGSIETMGNYIERMMLNVEVDELGNIIKSKKYHLGVEVIDSEWLNSEGISKGCLVTLGAESGVGKTELSILFMQSFARQDRKVLFASLEMGAEQLFELAVQEGKFKSIEDNETYRNNLNISFDISNINDLADTITIANRDKGIDVFVIDSYLPIETGFKNSRDNMDAITKMLDEMKRTLNVTIILIAQWSRADAKDGYYDFSGGTTLKYLSDFVLFIEKFENSQNKNTMRKITCAKNRVFPKFVDNSIITDYDIEKRKIIKICDTKDKDKMSSIEVNLDGNGKILRNFKRP